MKNCQILIIGVLAGAILCSQCGGCQPKPLPPLKPCDYPPCENKKPKKDKCDKCYYQRYYRGDCDCL